MAVASPNAFLIGSKSSSAGSKKLDFYESMYHFRKMFPKFDPDVIESVLRANQGAVDKTIDQLLMMSSDIAEASETNQVVVDLSEDYNSNEPILQSACNIVIVQDQPPSYNEFMSSKMSEMIGQNSVTNSMSKKSNIKTLIEVEDNKTNSEKNETLFFKEPNLDNFPSENNNKSLIEPLIESLNFESNQRRKKLLIGELPNDFLRVKLNPEQVKKLKSSIKKAKRSEITALLNNVNFECFTNSLPQVFDILNVTFGSDYRFVKKNSKKKLFLIYFFLFWP